MAPAFRCCTLEEVDGVAIFTVNRPKTLNALNPDTWEDFCEFAAYLADAPHLKVAIITGAGEKAFIAGADIGDLKETSFMEGIKNRLLEGLNALENGLKPVIAAVNGYALGGGMEVALACDIRIVSENAVFGLPETGLGIIPGAGGTQRLARLVGLGVAKDMVLAGRQLNAQEAVQYGLAMKCVPQDVLMDEAMKVAKTILKKAPLAIAFGKRAVNVSMDVDLKTALYVEALTNSILFQTEDKLEGTSAFVEKRKPNYKGK